MATENKVLTLAEVLALEEGRRVWVEMHHPADMCWSGVHIKGGNCVWNKDGPLTVGGSGHRAGSFRVWSLPQPPTQEEMDANPWEVRE